MIKIRAYLWLAIAGLVMEPGFSGQAVRAQELLNAVIAMVNETPITVDDVKLQTAPFEQQIYRQFGQNPTVLRQKINEMRQKYLELMIDRQLIISEFETEGYTMPESIVDDLVKERIRREYGDRLTLTKTLQSQGLTHESFRKRIREEVIVDALMAREINSVVLISPFEIERYYAENIEQYQRARRVRLWMIFIQNRPDDDQAAGKLLGEIREKILAGASFSEMASIYDSGTSQAKGGDWGWVEESVLREDLAAVAFALKAGEMSEIVSKEEGCYLMRVDEHRPAEPQPLDEVRSDIEKILMAEERNRLQQQWISTLRKKSFVRYY